MAFWNLNNDDDLTAAEKLGAKDESEDAGSMLRGIHQVGLSEAEQDAYAAGEKNARENPPKD